MKTNQLLVGQKMKAVSCIWVPDFCPVSTESEPGAWGHRKKYIHLYSIAYIVRCPYLQFFTWGGPSSNFIKA
jgi:hypothetical protein